MEGDKTTTPEEVQLRALFVGLSGAGKTTALYKLKLGELVTAKPTEGFQVETFSFQGVEYTVWDVGGANRGLWRFYTDNNDVLVFFIDSNDRKRIPEALEALQAVLREDGTEGIPLLVWANKQDGSNAVSVMELKDSVSKVLKSDTRKWYVQPSNARTGDGLYEGLEWLNANKPAETKAQKKRAEKAKKKALKAQKAQKAEEETGSEHTGNK